MKIKVYNFIGADDEKTCSDCRQAMNGNPWKKRNVPMPGKLKCGDQCRHAVQMVEKEVGFSNWIKWIFG